MSIVVDPKGAPEAKETDAALFRQRYMSHVAYRNRAMNILSLDLGTKTGWALSNETGVYASGVEDFKSGRFEGSGMRYVRFRRWIGEMLEEPGLVYFEEVRRHMGVDAAHAYGGFMGQLTAVCETRGLPYSGVPVGTIKKFWTGKGNANKQKMIDEAVKRGFEPEDDNEADAIALAHWAMEQV